MRHRLRLAAALAVLAAPAVIAFFSGGYFDPARDWAAAAAWALVALAALTAPRRAGGRPEHGARLTRSPGALLLVALAAFTAWTGLSLLWAPVTGPALDGLTLGLLYTGALAAAVALVPPVHRAVEPALLAGCTVVALYALAERLLPGAVHYRLIASAGDRLDQPLTYWNALGVLSALGLVLSAGLGVDPRRGPAVRAAAAAAASPLGLALYLTYSRGALGAAAAGLAVLLALQPSLRTARAVAVAALAGAVPAAATAVLPAVTRTGGSGAQGAAMLVLLVAAAAGAALLSRRSPLPDAPRRPLRAAALAAIAAALVISAVASLSTDRHTPAAPSGATAQRLVSAQSNRYEYWKVAAGVWADHPVLGVGSGGFAVEWLQRRDIAESVRDAHSLYIETAAELGLVGLLLLAALVVAAVRTTRGHGPEAAGAAAALAAFALHAGLDWDWEMPAVTLVAVVLLARLTSRPAPRAAPEAAAAASAPAVPVT